jgi:hypothetical protein
MKMHPFFGMRLFHSGLTAAVAGYSVPSIETPSPTGQTTPSPVKSTNEKRTTPGFN